MNKKQLATVILCFVFVNIFAQAEKNVKQNKIFFSSYIGLANAVGDVKNTISSGFQAMTGIELKLNKLNSICGEINFDSYTYNEKTTTYNIDGAINTIPLTIAFKHYFGANKWIPYFKIGGGVANFSKPIVEQKNGFTNIKTDAAIIAQYQAAIGIHYNLKPGYIIFIETGFQKFSNTRLLINKLNTVALRVGLSTAL